VFYFIADVILGSMCGMMMTMRVLWSLVSKISRKKRMFERLFSICKMSLFYEWYWNRAKLIFLKCDEPPAI
jgi:hypothetical protein